jgi:hypothetical protein
MFHKSDQLLMDFSFLYMKAEIFGSIDTITAFASERLCLDHVTASCHEMDTGRSIIIHHGDAE